MDNIALTQRLAEELESYYGGDYKQKVFAKECNVSEAYVSKMLDEDKDITDNRGIRELISVAQKLDVSVDYLLGLSDVKRCSQEAKDIEYISRILGLSLDNTIFLHDESVNNRRVIITDDGREHIFVGENNRINNYINFFIDIGRQLYEYCQDDLFTKNREEFLHQIVPYLTDEEWLYLFCSAELFGFNNSSTGMINLVSNLIEKSESLDVLLYRMGNVFDRELSKFLQIDERKNHYFEMHNIYVEQRHAFYNFRKNKDDTELQQWLENHAYLKEKIERFLP